LNFVIVCYKAGGIYKRLYVEQSFKTESRASSSMLSD